MNKFIFITLSLFVLISLFFLIISPTVQILVAFIVSLSMLLVTKIKPTKISRILPGIILLGCVIWIVFEYNKIEPYIVLLSSIGPIIQQNQRQQNGFGDLMTENKFDNLPEIDIDITNQLQTELVLQWKGLTERIEAINRDLSTEMDSERKYTLETRLSRLRKDRAAIETKIKESSIKKNENKSASK
jgi:energy-coupling factor transporter transmembrane protein EcfT